MKTNEKQNIILTVAAVIAALGVGIGSAHADKKHDHDHKKGEAHDHKHDHKKGEAHDHDHDHDHDHKLGGPHGGRLLYKVEPHLEFKVTQDRKVTIYAVEHDGKAVPIAEQHVRVIGGDRSKPTRLNFTKEGDVLVSDVAFPEGNDFPVVVQIKATPDAKTVTERFNLNLKDCPTCDNQEYACDCDHDHDHDHDHKHEKKDAKEEKKN